jgi:hypothetical protein
MPPSGGLTGRNLRVVSCARFARDAPSAEHDLVRAFRSGDPGAFAAVLLLVRETLATETRATEGARLVVPGTLVVAVPGHAARSVNGPCQTLVAALAASVPGLVPGPGVLVRVLDAPEGKAGGRRDAAAEAATLRWRGDLVPPGVRRVLLVDDVVRSGASFDAAVRALPESLAASAVALAIFRADPPAAGS